ncbi:hypothetical protein D3C78_1242170 [compost metagenome]
MRRENTGLYKHIELALFAEPYGQDKRYKQRQHNYSNRIKRRVRKGFKEILAREYFSVIIQSDKFAFCLVHQIVVI